MNFFEQGIPLGRWFKITVVIHWTFIAFAVWEIWSTPAGQQMDAAILMGLLFATVLLHEFGHALACQAVGGRADHIVLWPLGGIAFVQPPNKVWAWLVTTACGPLVNAVLWPLFWVIWRWGLPALASHMAMSWPVYKTLSTLCEDMAWVNKVLLLFNLIPAYPMDGGRLLQEVLWLIIGYAKSLQIAGMVGTVAGGSFIVLGLGLQRIDIPGFGFPLGGEFDPILIFIGILCMTQSFGIYRQSQDVRSWRKN
jgi:Zn-dependent protease